MIPRGTTPSHKFRFPFNYDDMEKITITYKQIDNIIQKNKQELISEPGFLISTLTQAETLSLLAYPGALVEIQIKCKDLNGIIKTSNVIVTEVGKLLDEGVM